MKEQKMVENAKEMGSYLFDRLQELKKYKYVGDVRGGKGLLATVEIVKNKDTKEKFSDDDNLYGIMPKLLKDRGLLSYRAGDQISMCPPLNISKEEIDIIFNGIESTIIDFEKKI